MDLDWNDEKDVWLKSNRGVGFDDVVESIASGGLLDRRKHHNQVDYPNQEEWIVLIKEYIYVVPCVRTGRGYFLKTVIPNRKEFKKYLKGK